MKKEPNPQQTRDELLLRLLKTPPQSREEIKNEKKAIKDHGASSTVRKPAKPA